MSALVVRVAGVGLWAAGLPGWAASLPALCGKADVDLSTTQKPSPPHLPPAERRRAPETVLFAAQAAAEACTAAGLAPDALPAVFGSSQGDVAISDYLCATLAAAPHELSPTKFHNSVHNAAVGYWTIATGCRAPSTAMTAARDTAGASLLEAALQVRDDATPVLLAVYDTAAKGPLAEVVPNALDFAFALVLDVDAPGEPGARLAIEPAQGLSTPTAPGSAWARELAARNASAAALPLLEALAGGVERRVLIAAGPGFVLDVAVRP
jgi:hypothetical protein